MKGNLGGYYFIFEAEYFKRKARQIKIWWYEQIINKMKNYQIQSKKHTYVYKYVHTV